MAQNEYRELLSLFFERGKKTFLESQSLEELLQQTISYDRGLELVQPLYPTSDKTQILRKLTAADLLYLSLADRIPNRADPLVEEYNVTSKGIRFKTKQRQISAKFVPPVDYYVDSQFEIISRTERQVLEEGASLNRYFRYNFPSDESGEMKFYDLSLDEVTTLPNGLFPKIIENPEEINNISEKSGLMFTASGILILDINTNSVHLEPYTPNLQQQIDNVIREHRKYNKTTPSLTVRDELKVFRDNFMMHLYNFVNNTVRTFSTQNLSDIEQRAFNLEKGYGVKIDYRGMDFDHQRFHPPINNGDLNVIENILEIIQDTFLKYFSEIQKINGPRRYDGSKESALQLMDERVSRLYSRAVTSSQGKVTPLDNRLLSHSPSYQPSASKGIIILDEVGVEALKEDFNRYLPYHLSSIGRNLFLGLPENLSSEYLQLAKPEIERQLDLIQVMGYDRKRNESSLTMVDFMRFISEYHIAHIERRPYSLDEGRVAFYDKLFGN